jgi:2-polyprenyl-3-methyl-5-hydroxy-6-metoxy-1,4-benzoquinol methylase
VSKEEKPPGYYDGINVGLLDSIPADAKLVLEIGCGSGRLGAAYKQRNPDATYCGVEIVEDVAKEAAKHLDRVICASAESVDLSDLDGKIDCLVYGDVLEHLVDPWSTLKTHAAMLRPGGRVFACIPNIQHWTLLQHLLQGHWVYSDHGLLDSTHLRFFTLSSLGPMFAAAKLRIDNVIGMQVNRDAALVFLAKMRPALPNLGVSEDAFMRGISALQYLVAATRV